MKVTDYNHVIIYAKGWYKQDNVVEDLRRIFAVRSGLEPKHISDANVWGNMVSVLMKYANLREVERVLDGLFQPIPNEAPGLVFTFSDNNCPLSRAVRRIMTVLSQLKVRDDEKNVILNLGRPDPDILPLEKKDSLERWDAFAAQTEEVVAEG